MDCEGWRAQTPLEQVLAACSINLGDESTTCWKFTSPSSLPGAAQLHVALVGATGAETSFVSNDDSKCSSIVFAILSLVAPTLKIDIDLFGMRDILERRQLRLMELIIIPVRRAISPTPIHIKTWPHCKFDMGQASRA